MLVVVSTTELGRFKLVTDRREMASPAEDFFTGKVDEPYFIDTDRDVYDGRINIGASTAENIATLIGYIPNDEFELLCLRNKELEEENARFRNLITGAHSAAVELATALLSAPADEVDEPDSKESEGRARKSHPASKGRNGSADLPDFG